VFLKLEVNIVKEPEETDQHASPGEAHKVVRKPYRKPAVRHERVFETSALTCGKVSGTQGQCFFNKKTS
jgi:hypothetical protein